jgi:uncharacterized protein
MRPRYLLIGLAVVVLAALISLSVLDRLLVDFLWYGNLGFSGPFATTVGSQVGIFGLVWVVTFIAITVSGLIAIKWSRERLRVVRRADEMVEVNLPELIRALGDRVPWRLIVIAGAAVLALFVAQGEAASWDIYLKGFYGLPFGIKDPAFGHDIGFYIFSLPLLEEMRDLFLMLLFLTAATTAGMYWARGSIDFRESPPRVSPAAATHLSVLLALFFVQRAVTYWLARYALLLHTDGVVYGLRYVDRILWQPGFWLLVVLALAGAALCLANTRRGGLRLPVIAFVIVFGPGLILNLIQPAIERLWVKPDELRVEKPYIERNIEATRHAYRLDGIDVKPFAGQNNLTPAGIQEDNATVKNIRLWDPRPLIDTYRQLQEIRLYYDFRDVDIDRYWINGDYTEVMLSAREMNVDALPDNAQTWVNQHLKFTHGAGLAMSPVNAKDSEGLPIFYVKDIPAVSDVGLKITQPAIYFGEEPRDNYAIVDSATPEFDYPRGADNVFSYYAGDGGVPVAGFWRRLLFSIFERDINLLVTENIVPKSKIMIRRNIIDRIKYLAPFLTIDDDPYAVIHDGRIMWIVDAYTTSDHYPYSQMNELDINYIRNSVKVVVDAYTGETTFYVADPDDPIIKTWQRIFPTLFRPIADMPPDLHAHIRYPENFFLVQADIYRTYHMTDPQVFYNREDLWGFPNENYGGQTVQMQPYYVIMRLPGEKKAEYMLMLPMVPHGRDNMISWLAARCDGADYGHLFEYSFSKDKLFYGPYQIQARINQSPEISRQLSLWNQMGSKVILGNLLVIPIQDALLYVEPLFIRAENGQLPQLQRVIAAYSDRVVMGDTLELTLASLFHNQPPLEPTLAAAATAPTAETASLGGPLGGKPGLDQATADYNRAMTALKQGNWQEFGAEMQKLGQALGPSQDSVHQ